MNRSLAPENKIKREILRSAVANGDFGWTSLSTDEQVAAAYCLFSTSDARWDYEGEFRCGHFETNIGGEYSRHYSSKSVGAKMCDGTYIGWTHWYGGGKHGEPEAIAWIEHAYELNCVERQELVTLRTFSKKE